MKNLKSNFVREIAGKALVVIVPLALGMVGVVAGFGVAATDSTVAFAQEGPPPFPPATYVATVEPVYYQGAPMYWYNNYWYWRDAHAQWHYYQREPQFLHERRMHAPPARYVHEQRYPRRR